MPTAISYDEVEVGQELPAGVFPVRRATLVQYAGASGDFNPIHIDEEFARRVGLPGRILHGLWTMAQVARAHTDAAGGPERLKRLSVQFRGMGRLDQELVVEGTVREVGDGVAKVDSEARQGDARLIRNAVAELVTD
jgi:acyl dehydratase